MADQDESITPEQHTQKILESVFKRLEYAATHTTNKRQHKGLMQALETVKQYMGSTPRYYTCTEDERRFLNLVHSFEHCNASAQGGSGSVTHPLATVAFSPGDKLPRRAAFDLVSTVYALRGNRD